MANGFINSSIAPSTTAHYSSCFQRYINWCASLQLLALPLHEQNLILFSSHLALTSSYNNVKLHLAAIKFVATANGYRVEQFRRLYLTVRGIKKAQGSRFRKPKRLPVTPDMLRRIKVNLFGSSLRFHDKCMLWAAMTTAFFGLLRASEYTCKRASTYDPEMELCNSDVTCRDYDATVNIKASKTDIFRSGTSIRLVANNSSLCPVNALQQYLRIRTRHPGPLFQFSNGNFLRRAEMAQHMKTFSGCTSNLSTH